MDSNKNTILEVERTNDNESTLITQYIKTLNEKELHGYNIAKEHLGMSFQIEKSIGFINWKKTNAL
tara:strand:+ start:1289 stop:1486 length:198 start_codon:yes stop_codon:yes gene_type:complete